MRVGLVIYGSLDTLSGGFLYDRELVRALRRAGHEVRVLSLPWRSYAFHLGDNITPRVWRMFLKTHVDVWLQDELNHPSLFGLNPFLRRKAHGPLVSIVHHLRRDESAPAWLRPLYAAVEGAYLRTVDGFVFNSQTTRARVQEVLGKPPTGVVGYPAADHVLAGTSNPPLSPEDIRRRAYQPGPLQLLFVGNLIPRKGLETVLRAMTHVPVGTVILDVVGRDVDSAYATRVRTLVRRWRLEGRVRFWGYLAPADLRQRLVTAHVLVVPSQYEGFGIVYLEGMAFGLPAIGSVRGAAREIITPDATGYLVEPGDAHTLAAHLVSWFEDREKLTRMGIAAVERYKRHPTWAESMGRVVHWLETFVAQAM